MMRVIESLISVFSDAGVSATLVTNSEIMILSSSSADEGQFSACQIAFSMGPMKKTQDHGILQVRYWQYVGCYLPESCGLVNVLDYHPCSSAKNILMVTCFLGE